jgi:hypothetical protein
VKTNNKKTLKNYYDWEICEVSSIWLKHGRLLRSNNWIKQVLLLATSNKKAQVKRYYVNDWVVCEQNRIWIKQGCLLGKPNKHELIKKHKTGRETHTCSQREVQGSEVGTRNAWTNDTHVHEIKKNTWHSKLNIKKMWIRGDLTLTGWNEKKLNKRDTCKRD